MQRSNEHGRHAAALMVTAMPAAWQPQASAGAELLKAAYAAHPTLQHIAAGGEAAQQALLPVKRMFDSPSPPASEATEDDQSAAVEGQQVLVCSRARVLPPLVVRPARQSDAEQLTAILQQAQAR